MLFSHTSQPYQLRALYKLQKGQIWCVYDKDSFPADDFNGEVLRAERLNKENPELQYHTAWSNECIEFWFLLHFAYYTLNNHRTEYISFFNDKFRELGIGKYQKNMKNIFDILMEKGNPKLAIRYAKRIIKENQSFLLIWKRFKLLILQKLNC